MASKDFKCCRCGSEATTKANLIRHLNTIIPCPTKISDTSRAEILKSLEKAERKCDTVVCDWCKKEYSDVNLKRHKLNCKSKPVTVNVNVNVQQNAEITNLSVQDLHELIKNMKKEIDIINNRCTALENITINIETIDIASTSASVIPSITATHTKKKTKSKIPQSLRIATWKKYVGEDHGKSICLCCKSAEISVFTFHCAHVIAECKGGQLTLENLRPVCTSCNLSMGSQNLYDYSNSHFGSNMVE